MSVFPRRYRFTIAIGWYDAPAEFQREIERHFTAARRGSIPNTRRRLARRCLPIIQREIYQRHRIWIPARRLKVRFEREEPTTQVQPDITSVGRTMRYRGKHWSATALPPKVIPYAKKSRRAKTRKGKRAKGR